MQKLSVVIITFNESKNIVRCLQSLTSIADEFIVYDSFSTDNTCELAKQHGAKIFTGNWQGYALSKNLANQKATFDWILSIDADEVLSVALQNSILKLKESGLKTASFKRLTNYCGKWIKHCGWYPDKKLRLWDSRNGSWTGVNPHDKYEMKDGDTNTSHIKGDILHYSYYSINEHIKQTDYFTTIGAKALFNEGKKATFVKMHLSPIGKFISAYFLKLGIFDGYYGFVVCKISAKSTFLKYKKLKELYNV